MPLETFNYLDSLVPDNPGVNDGVVNGDDHIRGIKLALKNTFPNLNGPVTVSPAVLNALNIDSGVKPGALQDYAMATAPSGWLACDGQAVSRTTYAALFAAIGTTWGAGDGSTTFNVPNLQDRFRRHRSSGSYAGNVGNTQGFANAAHTHGVSGTTSTASNDHYHNQQGSFSTGAMSANASHTHTGSATLEGGTIGASVNNTAMYGQNTSAPNNLGPLTVSISTVNTDHTHSVTISGGTSGVSADHNHTFAVNSGGGTADASEARPLSATVLTCIKT